MNEKDLLSIRLGNMVIEKKLVTIDVAAKILGVSTLTVRRWLKGGWLQYKKFGGRYYINVNDIANVVESVTNKQEQEQENTDINNADIIKAF